MKRAGWVFVFPLLASLVCAEEWKLAVVTGGTTGDRGRRDDTGAFREGLEVSFKTGGGLEGLTLEWMATKEGKLDFSLTSGEAWRFKGQLVRSRRFSDTSAYPELTPLGTPVSELYPFTNTLEPAFDGLDPVLTRNRVHLELIYGKPWQGLTVWFSGNEQSGHRTSQVGGMAFGDLSAPAFFPASLTRLDTSHWDLGVRVYRRKANWWVNGSLSGGSFSSSEAALLPTYGQASLLDVTNLKEKHRADLGQASLSGGFTGKEFTVLVGGAYSRVKGTPGFSYGLNSSPWTKALVNADSRAVVRSGAGSLVYRPLDWLWLRLTGRARTQTTRAQGQESFFASGFGASRDHFREDSGEGEITARRGGLTFRLRGGISDGTKEVKQTHGESLVDYSSDLSRRFLVSQLAYRFGGSWQIRMVAGQERRERSVNLADLVWGYAVGDNEDSLSEARFELRKRVANWDLGLVWATSKQKQTWQPPFYDPIYDPSWELTEAVGRVKGTKVLMHATYAGGDEWSAWLEGGYQDDQWLFPTVTFPGFLWVEERVKGPSVAGGLSFALSPRSQVQVAGSWQQPRDTVAHRWGWLDVTWTQELGKDKALFVRAFGRKLDEKRYQKDDYTLKAVSLGLKGSF